MSGGASAGSGSTAFSRHGSASQETQTQLDSAFLALANANTPKQNQDPAGYNYQKSQMVSPTNYEANTQDLYENRLLRGLAMAKSGTAAVSAPINRGVAQNQSEVMEQFARERGKEVREQQVVDRQIGTGAATAFNEGQNTQQRVSTDSLTALANLIYPKASVNNENFTGSGNQSSSAYSFGTPSCCFIFLEAYKGTLPWWVRECRDDHAGESTSRRRGYRNMSRWLVPAMRVSKLARAVVWWGMIKPLTLAGGWKKNVPGYKNYYYLAPVAYAWFFVWSMIGKLSK